MNKPMKLTPIYTTIQSLNAQIVDQNGWQLPNTFTTLDEELAAARERVALADLSASSKINVEGAQAAEVIQAGLNVNAPGLAINAGFDAGNFDVYRLREDMFFIHTPPGEEETAIESLKNKIRVLPRSSASHFVTATDVTHGRSEFTVIGPSSAELLSRFCSLDFHNSQFPNLTAKQSNLVKTNQLILRHDIGDLPAYALIGARSLGAYLWEIIMEAGRDLEIAPVGFATLQSLKSGE